MSQDIQRINQFAENIINAPESELRKVPKRLINELIHNLEVTDMRLTEQKTKEALGIKHAT